MAAAGWRGPGPGAGGFVGEFWKRLSVGSDSARRVVGCGMLMSFDSAEPWRGFALDSATRSDGTVPPASSAFRQTVARRSRDRWRTVSAVIGPVDR